MSTETAFSSLAGFIASVRNQGQAYVIGVDGFSASGKSTFSARLSEALAAAGQENAVLPMDDLFSPELHREQPGSRYPGFDMDRIAKAVIGPLKEGRSVEFHRYDQASKSMDGLRRIPENLVIIFEGVFSTGRLLGRYTDLRLWLDCPRPAILMRGEERSGEPGAGWGEKWLPAEDAYVAREVPAAMADLTVDGTWQRDGLFLATGVRHRRLADWLGEPAGHYST